MSVFKSGFRLFLIAAAAALSGSVTKADAPFHPFAESLDVDPDWQLFAPVDLAELEELSARKRANRGWFVGFDRMHFGLNRPSFEGQTSKIDMTWGNRWDFGFMGKDDKGILFTFWNVSGPNVYDDIRELRTLLPGAEDERFPQLRPRVPYDPSFGDGTLLVRQSVNVANLTNFEMNRTWRFEPYRYGGILEPLVGFRYMQFNDFAQNENTFGIDTDGDGVVDFDGFNKQITRTDNRMVLAQVGYRYFSTVKRMTFSNELRVFAGPNFQTQGFSSRTFIYQTASELGGFIEPTAIFGGRDNNEFVVGFDTRLEGALQVTKNFNLRSGVQVLYVGRGVWRGANPGFGPQNANDQNLISPSFTFGATFNR